MANEDKPDTSTEPEAPKSEAGPSAEQPPAAAAEIVTKRESIKPAKANESETPKHASNPPAPIAAAPHAHASDAHAHGAEADHGLAHTMPIWMLVAVLGALMLLTVLTVSVTSYDLGSEGNLVVGMVIATVKAGLVITFFMHLLWDKKFHLILFLTAVLFVILFLSMSITDRGEYQPTIDSFQNTTSAAAK